MSGHPAAGTKIFLGRYVVFQSGNKTWNRRVEIYTIIWHLYIYIYRIYIYIYGFQWWYMLYTDYPRLLGFLEQLLTADPLDASNNLALICGPSKWPKHAEIPRIPQRPHRWGFCMSARQTPCQSQPCAWCCCARLRDLACSVNFGLSKSRVYTGIPSRNLTTLNKAVEKKPSLAYWMAIFRSYIKLP